MAQVPGVSETAVKAAEKAQPGAFDPLDPPSMDKILDCVHCGFCLPTCPTYLVLGNEMDSPRGRIYLMRSAAEGRIGIGDSFVKHMNLCLVCRACETACPSGVEYGHLIEAARGQVERQYELSVYRPRLPEVYPAHIHRSETSPAPPRADAGVSAAWSSAIGEEERRPQAAGALGGHGSLHAEHAGPRPGSRFPRGHPGHRAPAGPGRPAPRMRPARVLSGRQPGHRARTGRKRLRSGGAREAGLLRVSLCP